MAGAEKPKRPRTPTPVAERMPTAKEVERVVEPLRALGFAISGVEVAPGKVVRVLFAEKAASDPDAELDRWMRGRRGAG